MNPSIAFSILACQRAPFNWQDLGGARWFIDAPLSSAFAAYLVLGKWISHVAGLVFVRFSLMVSIESHVLRLAITSISTQDYGIIQYPKGSFLDTSYSGVIHQSARVVQQSRWSFDYRLTLVFLRLPGR